MYLSFSLVVYRWCGQWVANPSLGCTVSLGVLSFVLAEAIAVFNYLLALAGSICFAPMAIVIPGFLYLYDYRDYRTGTLARRAKWFAHVLIVLLGAFVRVGGTYSSVKSIKLAYANGLIGSAFSCADNSGTVGG